MWFSLAIDGPAAAGKSTTSKEVARELDFLYVDTGAMYRSVAFYMIKNNVDISDAKEIMNACKNIKLDLKIENNETIVLLNGYDISEKIRTEKISMTASLISANDFIRKFLLNLQRKFVKKYNIVMDGRDIGTKIIPNAFLKIFLTASLKERAIRRFEDIKKRGSSITYEEILKDIKKRDDNDKNRNVSPLKPAADAILLDNTNLSFKETVKKIIAIFKSKI